MIKILATTVIPGKFSRLIIYPVLLMVLFFHLYNHVFSAYTDNGFDLGDALVPSEEIYHGGPSKDGIPAIDDPKFVSEDTDNFLSDEDRILGISHNGVSKAYPIRILNYHEIVNDEFAGEPIVISYCPLCGSGVAFSAITADGVRSFGVSGLLYNSDVLLYDRQTESLWSQLLGQAVTGPLKGSQLTQVNLSHTTWSDWRRRHPGTLVLSTDTSFSRDYASSPYAGYESVDSTYFPVSHVNNRYHPKEMVIGVQLNGVAKVYPFAELSRSATHVNDVIGGVDIVVEFDAHNRTGRILLANGHEIPSTIAYWFAWYTFHPETVIYQAP